MENGNSDVNKEQQMSPLNNRDIDELRIKIPDMVKGKIHPVVIFPFAWKKLNNDLDFLYNKIIAKLDNNNKYARPITVMDYKTYYNHAQYTYETEDKDQFKNFLINTVNRYSDLIVSWNVDTCQMWNTGLGKAFNDGLSNDVYWLIPGDFFYSKKPEIIELLMSIPEAVRDHGQDFCIGEIKVDVNSSKQLIDTYSTYGLLYNWFPHEAQKIREKTDKPRTEFFAISGSFLEDVLRQRWYAYEQTIVILLYGIVSRKRIHRVELGNISDLPEGRETLASAMQQVERTERVLKMVWREMNEQESGWIDRFRILDKQSSQVRGAAITILQNLLS